MFGSAKGRGFIPASMVYLLPRPCAWRLAFAGVHDQIVPPSRRRAHLRQNAALLALRKRLVLAPSAPPYSTCGRPDWVPPLANSLGCPSPASYPCTIAQSPKPLARLAIHGRSPLRSRPSGQVARAPRLLLAMSPAPCVQRHRRRGRAVRCCTRTRIGCPRLSTACPPSWAALGLLTRRRTVVDMLAPRAPGRGPISGASEGRVAAEHSRGCASLVLLVWARSRHRTCCRAMKNFRTCSSKVDDYQERVPVQEMRARQRAPALGDHPHGAYRQS